MPRAVAHLFGSQPTLLRGKFYSSLFQLGSLNMRPAHMHAIVSAPGYEQVITHVFVDGDPYLDNDAVYAVKNSLVGKYTKVKDAALAKRRGLSNPFQSLEFDFHLSPAKKGMKARKKIWRGERTWQSATRIEKDAAVEAGSAWRTFEECCAPRESPSRGYISRRLR